jgi:hypothetical protein
MKAVHGETRNIQQDLQSMHLDHQKLEQNQRGMTTEITDLSRQTATIQHQMEECSYQGIVIK